MSVNQIADILGVTRRTINRMVTAGMPQAGHGKYDMRACVQWKLDQVAGAAAEEGVDGATDSARRELYIAQRHKIELEIAERRRELLPAALVDHTMASVASVAASQLDSLGPRMAGELADSDDPAWIQSRLLLECRAIRQSIAEQIRQMSDAIAEQEIDDGDDGDDDEDPEGDGDD